MDRTSNRRQWGRVQLLVPMADALLRLGEWQHRRQMRKALRLSETLLRDIGLMPADVEAALAAPLDRDASDRLLRETVARAGNW